MTLIDVCGEGSVKKQEKKVCVCIRVCDEEGCGVCEGSGEGSAGTLQVAVCLPACLLNKTSACGWAGSDQCIISVACSTFTVLCSYHLYLVPEHFVPQMKP